MNLRNLIFHNIRLKLFSLLIAVLLWEAIHLATRVNPGSEDKPVLVIHTNNNSK